MFHALLSLLSLLVYVNGADELSAKAWKANGKYPTANDYPESKLKEINSRPNTAIAFSGGGSRSFAASAGYLAGLTKLGLMDNVRYIGGISGGSWATTVYTYAQDVTDDSSFLGTIVNPEDIVDEELKEMGEHCMRRLTANELTLVALEAFVSGTPAAEAYALGIQQAYLDPIGVPAATRFSWSEEIVSDIKLRNPLLENETFLLPANENRPYMILGAAIVGPTKNAPYHSDHHNFTMVEFTPLYTGQMYSSDVEYQAVGLIHNDHWNAPIRRHVGGVVESFAFNRGTAEERSENVAPEQGLPSDSSSGDLRVPAPSNFLDLNWAAGASGYAIGAFMESGHFPREADKLGMHFQYWSPSESNPSSMDTLFTDGGCYENDALLPMIQRKVEKVILFLNPHTPLQPSQNWDVDTDVPSSDQIDPSIGSFFGVLPPPGAEYEERNFMLSKNQIFPSEDYSTLIKGLQAAQTAGGGIVYGMNLTTVENEWWGIPAGFQTEVTFVYLGRLSKWETKLSQDMQSKVIPTDGNPNDMSNTIDSGEYKHFPHYVTAGGLLTHQQTNLLADMSGWVILENQELFERLLS